MSIVFMRNQLVSRDGIRSAIGRKSVEYSIKYVLLQRVVASSIISHQTRKFAEKTRRNWEKLGKIQRNSEKFRKKQQK